MKRALQALRRVLASGAFTLIELLTVIAIIGILAGILLPVITIARRHAREAVARADVKSLDQALQTYTLAFGVFPPDNNAGLLAPGVAFDNMNTPNECMVWFLMRTYDTSAAAAGHPDDWNPAPPNGWNPAVSSMVFSRESTGPYCDVKAGQRRDYDSDGFLEFVDPWGRPYMYRSEPHTLVLLQGPSEWKYENWLQVGNVVPAGNTATLTISGAEGRALDPLQLSLTNVVGTVEMQGFDAPSYNGSFTFTGGPADNQLTIDFGSAPGTPTIDGNQLLRFPLHNVQSCDIYSLGPNGLTSATRCPLPVGADGRGTEWKPSSGSAEFVKWVQVWGTSGDGNDMAANKPNANIVINETDRDDINNW